MRARKLGGGPAALEVLDCFFVTVLGVSVVGEQRARTREQPKRELSATCEGAF